MNKVFLRKLFIYSAFIVVLGILQLKYPSALEFKGVIPDFLLVLTVIISFYHGMNDGIIVGIICGLIKDIYSSRFIGLGILILMYCAIASANILKKHISINFFSGILQVGLVTLIYYILIGLFLFVNNGTIFPFSTYVIWWTKNRILPGLTLNIVSSIPLILILKAFSPEKAKETIENTYLKTSDII